MRSLRTKRMLKGATATDICAAWLQRLQRAELASRTKSHPGCACLQTVNGKEAQGLPSSEWAAMLDLVILPELRRFYEGAGYEAACKSFAKRLGLDDKHWHKVHLPAFISWDNAPVHRWAHKLVLQPRQADDKVSGLIKQEYEDQLRKGEWGDTLQSTAAPSDFGILDVFPERKLQPAAPGPDTSITPVVAQNILARLRQEPVLGGHQKARAYVRPPPRLTPQEADDLALRKLMTRRLDSWAIKNEGASWMALQLKQLTFKLPGMLCLLPQQIMPLPKVTPDIHCPVEHMVNTIKTKVYARVREHLFGEDMMKGVTYQRWVNDVIEKHCNGEPGRKHVRRSVEKQFWICKIVAAAPGAMVQVQWIFGDGGENKSGRKKTAHSVRGTGGHWIQDPRWG